jgi:hypothetical protein
MDQEAFIHWNFEGNSRLTGEFNFDGISLLKVDDAGKIILHHDIWDGSALMERIPFVRGIIRTLRKKLSHQ